MAEDKTENKLIDRLLGPSADRVGNALATIDEPLKHIYNSCQEFFSGEHKNTQSLKNMISEKLKGVPPEQLTTPAKNITIPLLQLNLYTDDESLRDFFSNLLKASMIIDSAPKASPSFVRTLEQLTPQEALFIKATTILEENNPIANISLQDKSPTPDFEDFPYLSGENIGRVLFSNFYITDFKSTKEDLQFMISNFIRLGLIEVDYSRHISDLSSYLNYSKELLYKFVDTTPFDSTKSNLVFVIGVITPTDYGKQFYNICVK